MEQQSKPAAKRGRPKNADRVDRGDQRIDTWVDKPFFNWFSAIRVARGGNKQDLAREALRRGLRSLARELDELGQGKFPFVPDGAAAAARDDLVEPPATSTTSSSSSSTTSTPAPVPSSSAAPASTSSTSPVRLLPAGPMPVPPIILGQVKAARASMTSTTSSSSSSSVDFDQVNDAVSNCAAAEKLGRAAVKNIHNVGDRNIPNEPKASDYSALWMSMRELGVEESARLAKQADAIEAAFEQGWRRGRAELMQSTQGPSTAAAKPAKPLARDQVAKVWLRKGYEAASTASTENKSKKPAPILARPSSTDWMHYLPEHNQLEAAHKPVAQSAFEQGWWKRHNELEAGTTSALAKPVSPVVSQGRFLSPTELNIVSGELRELVREWARKASTPEPTLSHWSKFNAFLKGRVAKFGVAGVAVTASGGQHEDLADVVRHEWKQPRTRSSTHTVAMAPPSSSRTRSSTPAKKSAADIIAKAERERKKGRRK